MIWRKKRRQKKQKKQGNAEMGVLCRWRLSGDFSTWGREKIAIARKGDKVTCPVCAPHVFEIAEGCANSLDFGAPVALEGHATTCGAALLAQSGGAGS
ncbi:PAAR domain-containing protein [Burkholderia cepacia]|uniref:PAAR domain-containing protein n=1 Tax=Burkholderia cepacia TaxID=292 RepID=UPI0009C14FEC|nr:PAAR domain-containing protein [Burkholderia cepacia]